jgi:hypothetical protein
MSMRTDGLSPRVQDAKETIAVYVLISQTARRSHTLGSEELGMV